MPCPSSETLLAFVADESEPDERSLVVAHLETGCEPCRREVAAVSELRRLARDERFLAPSPRVLDRAARIPSARGTASELYRVAALLFDTLTTPLPLGARSALASERQLLFHADEYDIDVHVASAGSGAVRISGQVLPPARDSSISGLEVTLVHADRPPISASTNTLGEFAFDGVPEGEYGLIVECEGGRLLVEDFPARRA
jgi:hypothetical protein